MVQRINYNEVPTCWLVAAGKRALCLARSQAPFHGRFDTKIRRGDLRQHGYPTGDP